MKEVMWWFFFFFFFLNSTAAVKVRSRKKKGSEAFTHELLSPCQSVHVECTDILYYEFSCSNKIKRSGLYFQRTDEFTLGRALAVNQDGNKRCNVRVRSLPKEWLHQRIRQSPSHMTTITPSASPLSLPWSFSVTSWLSVQPWTKRDFAAINVHPPIFFFKENLIYSRLWAANSPWGRQLSWQDGLGGGNEKVNPWLWFQTGGGGRLRVSAKLLKTESEGARSPNGLCTIVRLHIKSYFVPSETGSKGSNWRVRRMQSKVS